MLKIGNWDAYVLLIWKYAWAIISIIVLRKFLIIFGVLFFFLFTLLLLFFILYSMNVFFFFEFLKDWGEKSDNRLNTQNGLYIGLGNF